MKIQKSLIGTCFALLLAIAGLFSVTTARAIEPSCVNEKDLPNFKRVDDKLFRGGQPTREGFICLQKMGIKTIINVRSDKYTGEYIKDLPFKYFQFSMKSNHPTEKGMVWFLKHATAPDNSPKFLHCQAGSHRTGWLVAMYRIMVNGWDRERAIEEMRAKDTGFNDQYPNLVEWIRNADLRKLNNKLLEANGG